MKETYNRIKKKKKIKATKNPTWRQCDYDDETTVSHVSAAAYNCRSRRRSRRRFRSRRSRRRRSRRSRNLRVIKFRPAAAKHCRRRRRPVRGCFPHVPAAVVATPRGGGSGSGGGGGGGRACGTINISRRCRGAPFAVPPRGGCAAPSPDRFRPRDAVSGG